MQEYFVAVQVSVHLSFADDLLSLRYNVRYMHSSALSFQRHCCLLSHIVDYIRLHYISIQAALFAFEAPLTCSCA